MQIIDGYILRIGVHDEDSIFWKKTLVSIHNEKTGVDTPIARLEFQDCYNEDYDFINILGISPAYDVETMQPYLILRV